MTAGLNNVLLPRLFKVVNDIVQHCYISLLLLSTQQLVHNLLVEISDSLYKIGLKTLIQTCCNKVARKLTTQLGTNSSNTTCRQIVSRLVTTCAFWTPSDNKLSEWPMDMWLPGWTFNHRSYLFQRFFSHAESRHKFDINDSHVGNVFLEPP